MSENVLCFWGTLCKRNPNRADEKSSSWQTTLTDINARGSWGFLLFFASSCKTKWQLWYGDLPTQLLVSPTGTKRVLLGGTRESSNTCAARKSSRGHIKSTGRHCSVLFGVHVVMREAEHESNFVLCPYSSINSRETKWSLWFCPSLGLTACLGHLFLPTPWGRGGMCPAKRLHYTVCLRCLFCSHLSHTLKANLFLAVGGPKSPRRKAGGVLICRQLRNWERSV